LAVLLWLVQPKLWPVAAVTAVFRALGAWSTAGWVLHDPLSRQRWWLIPIQDFISLLVWICGFFGNTIDWRGRRYKLLPDGRFEFTGTVPDMAGANSGVLSAAPFRPHDLTSTVPDNEIPGR
jgi:ceramide glucosyltransferase